VIRKVYIVEDIKKIRKMKKENNQKFTERDKSNYLIGFGTGVLFFVGSYLIQLLKDVNLYVLLVIFLCCIGALIYNLKFVYFGLGKLKFMNEDFLILLVCLIPILANIKYFIYVLTKLF